MLTVGPNNLQAALKQIKALTQKRVLVGIPATNASRGAGSVITNVQLGFIHEFGSPAQNIPARPFLVPGVRESKDEWTKRMLAAGKAASVGKSPDAFLEQAGQIAVNAVTRRIRAGIPPPLSPGTVRNRRRRSTGSSYRRKATRAADTTPLIDTGDMLRSITYAVETKK